MEILVKEFNELKSGDVVLVSLTGTYVECAPICELLKQI